jgi:hypothetical protein
MTNLKMVLELLWEIVNTYEDAESKSYSEMKDSGDCVKGHIYLKLKKLRKLLENWQKGYIAGCRYIILGSSDLDK